jgi:hypothetical protein
MAKLAWFLCLAVFCCTGVLGIYNGVTEWSVVTAIVCGVIVTYVLGVATIVYGEAGASLGSAIAASLGAGLVASIVVWTTRRVVT